MTDAAFLTAFEATTLDREDWTHDAHIRVAWLYLNQNSFPEALEKVRVGIQNLNRAYTPIDRCAPTKKGGGYHDTITVAFVRVIAGRLAPGEDYSTFRDTNADLFDRSLSAVRRHYTKKLLFSAKARKAFVEPDRAPLPVPAFLAEPTPRPTAKPRRQKAAAVSAV